MANVLPHAKQVAVLSALVEGCSVRSTERMTGVHRDTICRLLARVGEGCAALVNERMVNLDCARLEMDELWSYVGTNVYQHRWALGDLVLWDNRTTMHRRDPFDAKARRVMHRTQIKGTCAPRRALI